MSRHHAILSFEPNGVMISDDKSKFGTLIKLGSSFKVSTFHLPHVVQFGPGLLHFEVVDTFPRHLVFFSDQFDLGSPFGSDVFLSEDEEDYSYKSPVQKRTHLDYSPRFFD